MKKRNKNNLMTVFLVFVLFTGLSLLLYPTVADYWNSMHQSRIIASYTEAVSSIAEADYEQYWQDAQQYNLSVVSTGDAMRVLNDEETEQYNSALNIGGDGIMGYIEIPEIDVSLPIYHGTSEEVLQIAVGHLEWSSLPIGGEGTHCVLSGHRGLPSAKLFTHLDMLHEGDLFMLRVLDEVLTYEVDQVLIVEPHDVSALQAVEGMDYCTLVTCTPYGINTHRMLVRGHRTETTPEEASIRVTADAVMIEPLVVAPVLSVPMLIVLFILLFTKPVVNKQ